MFFLATRFTPVSCMMVGQVGGDIVLVFCFSSVIISIQLINMYISHDHSIRDLICEETTNISHWQGAIVYGIREALLLSVPC